MAAVSGGFDPFYDTSAGAGNGGSNYGGGNLSNGFTNNSLQYHSPTIGGSFQINAGAYLDDAVAGRDDHAYGIGGAYKSGAISASVQYLTVKNGTATAAGSGGLDSALRLTGRYKSGAIDVGASYQNLDLNAAGANDQNYFQLNGSYSINKTMKVSGSLGKVNGTPAATGIRADAGSSWTIGLFKTVAEKTKVYGYISEVDYDGARGDRKSAGIGVIHSFSGAF